MAIETAEEFAYRLDALPMANQARLVEARDAAVARAAKLELLEEIRGYASACPGAGDARYRALLSFLDAKYGAAKEPG